MSASSCRLGMMPASLFLSAFTMTMNRTLQLLPLELGRADLVTFDD
jgi:hypothetical protein